MLYIQFCQKILAVFKKKSQSILNLIITLAGDGKAKSVTELANNPLYKYKYSSISDAIDSVFKKEPDDTSSNTVKQRLDKDKENLKLFNSMIKFFF